jgi:hypothetical protein
MNEKEIIESYRDQVENLNVTPPESCWDNINTQLDLDDKWDSISLELNRVLPVNNDTGGVLSRKNQTLFTKLISIVSPIVLILLILATDNRIDNPASQEIPGVDISMVPADQIKAPQNYEEAAITPGVQKRETKAYLKAESVQQERKNESKILSTNAVPVIKRDIALTLGSSGTNPEIGLNSVKSYTIEEQIKLSEQKSFDPVIPFTSHPAQSILTPIVSIPSLSTSLVSLPGLATVNESLPQGQYLPGTKFRLNRFSVGISLIEKNTWLISQETFEGLDKQKLNTTKPKFLTDVGIILRYNQSEKWSFEGTGFLLSKTGQSYRQYLNGIYSYKSYELKYFSFELSARRKLFKSLNINNLRFYSITGMYVSLLNTAYKRIDQSLVDISPDYDPVDYGVILGCETEIALFGRIAVAPGFRIKYGIPNIFADKPGIPDELHSTRNASVEFRLNLILPFSNY